MKKINEELKYMKYLFGYQKGVVISEQETPTSNPTQGGSECETFREIGTFSEGVSDTDNAHLKVLLDKIIAKFPNGGDVKSMKIIGGASNAVGGVATAYDLDNNYTESPSPETTPRGPKYQKNIGYATNRANSARQPILDGLKNANITVSVEPTVEAKVINTGGKNDTTNAGAMNPGQIVIVEVVVCPVQQLTSREEINKLPTLKPKITPIDGEIKIPTETLIECFENSEIKIYYNKSGHYCNKAVYQVTANGIVLRRKNRNGEIVDYASLNNLKSKQNLFDDAEVTSSNEKTGEALRNCRFGRCGRSNTFILDKITNESFFNEGVLQKYNGALVVEAACYDKGQGEYNANSDCHTDVGGISFKITGQPAVNQEQTSTPNTFGEFVEIGRFEGCKNYKPKNQSKLEPPSSLTNASPENLQNYFKTLGSGN